MHCRRCPHLVRHGQLGADKQSIEFRNLCGLVIKQQQMLEAPPVEANATKKIPRKSTKKQDANAKDELKSECQHYPFPQIFDYIECEVYQSTFKSATRKNDVIPTRDFQYSDALSGSSITDMELL